MTTWPRHFRLFSIDCFDCLQFHIRWVKLSHRIYYARIILLLAPDEQNALMNNSFWAIDFAALIHFLYCTMMPPNCFRWFKSIMLSIFLVIFGVSTTYKIPWRQYSWLFIVRITYHQRVQIIRIESFISHCPKSIKRIWIDWTVEMCASLYMQGIWCCIGEKLVPFRWVGHFKRKKNRRKNTAIWNLKEFILNTFLGNYLIFNFLSTEQMKLQCMLFSFKPKRSWINEMQSVFG